MQLTEASQNSELKFTHNTVTLCSQLQGPLIQDKSCLAQIVFQIQITQNYVFEIQNTKYILFATKIQNTKYMQCILNMYFKYLYFKYFTTLVIPDIRGLLPTLSTCYIYLFTDRVSNIQQSASSVYF